MIHQLPDTAPDFARALVNLADPRLGAVVTFATDDFFADKARIIDRAPAVFIPGKYDDNGKWMDGWESRRKRQPGYDFLILKLGAPARLAGVDIDTSHFTGNFAPAASLEGCVSDLDVPGDDAGWVSLVGERDLDGDSHHFIAVDAGKAVTHVRLNIFPDGGVARLRLYGVFDIDWSARSGDVVDLAAMMSGGRPVKANNQHFGVLGNILAPGRGENMGDGWETRRRREPGNDWSIIQLGHVGTIERIEVDTAHFKGNFPPYVSLQAVRSTGGTDKSLTVESHYWPDLLGKSPLGPDGIFEFTGSALASLGPVSHIRINIHPDGGISRFRAFGRVA